jgi:hypothetical protein
MVSNACQIVTVSMKFTFVCTCGKIEEQEIYIRGTGANMSIVKDTFYKIRLQVQIKGCR